MENIIPRWEWRTFGEGLGDADQQFAALEPGGVQESDEIYLLSPVTDENVKIRDLLMDIKTLQQVNADGLEQWKPVMKGAFPLPAAQVKDVFEALGVAPPVLARADYTLEQFVDELAKPGGRLRVMNVHKKRGPLQGGRLHGRDDRRGGRRQEDTVGCAGIRRSRSRDYYRAQTWAG